MQLFQKKLLLSAELIPLRTDLSNANRSILLLERRDVASVAKAESVLHADSPSVRLQRVLPLLRGRREDGWALGSTRGTAGPPDPVLSRQMLSDWQREEQTSEEPTCQLPARLLPRLLHPFSHTGRSITGCVCVTLQRWHLQPGKRHDWRFTWPGLEGNLRTAHIALPEAFSGGLWTRCRGEPGQGLVRAACLRDGSAARERTKAPAEQAHRGEWKEKGKSRWKKGMWQTGSGQGTTLWAKMTHFSPLLGIAFWFSLSFDLYAYLFSFLPRSSSVGMNSMAMPLLLNFEILYRIWDWHFRLPRYKGTISFPNWWLILTNQVVKKIWSIRRFAVQLVMSVWV